MKARAFLHEAPPEMLYHYTTQAGLLGILAEKTIWASHTQYLNDAEEFSRALVMFRMEIRRRQKEGSDLSPEELDRLIQVYDAVKDNTVANTNVCVCSFSAEGDSLSQWRAYGGGSSGFAIGFRGAHLQRVATGSEDGRECGWLVPCRYDDAEQQDVVRTLVDDVLEELRTGGAAAATRRAGGFTPYVLRYAPIIKHPMFKHEREWRIITRPLSSGYEGFGFRAGVSTIVPYYSLPLGDPCGIAEVIIGPTPHPDLAVAAVQNLCVKHGLDDALVEASTVPYRNW